jgi:phosphopantothenoylcysteine decarboxylase/phosphopantothenate--cysteine ligase
VPRDPRGCAPHRLLHGPRPDLEGRQVVVSAGGTREPLDPVRYLGNRSSGKQGCGHRPLGALRAGHRSPSWPPTSRSRRPTGCGWCRSRRPSSCSRRCGRPLDLADVVVMAPPRPTSAR